MIRTVAIATLSVVVFMASGCDSKETGSAQPTSAGTGLKTLSLDLGGGVTVKLVQIPPGKFLMGSPRTDKDRALNETQYQVTISKPFYIGVHEVTVDQYARFLAATGRRHTKPAFQQTGNHPAVNVSWEDAQEFCKWLSAKTGRTVILPTEAQWEYACRAGSTSRYSSGDSESSVRGYGWHRKNSGDTTHPVGQKTPNSWGLYDMHGNVGEWCSDWYANYAAGDKIDPVGPASTGHRVVRGGSWIEDPWCCRSASRTGETPDHREDTCGFRLMAVVVGGD